MTTRNLQTPYDVAIIGAGFSGTMVAVHLARLAPEQRVLVIDRAGAAGRGVAYGTSCPEHLLNVPAGKMSAFPDDPDNFFRWAKSHGPGIAAPHGREVSRDSFLPRKMYGQYLRGIFEEARRSAPGIETASAEIEDIELSGGDLILIGRGDARFRAGKAVLVLGNFPPGDPAVKDRRFHSSARYLNSPWAANVFKRIQQDDDLLIVGSGLTALDLLAELDTNKARGAIHVVSRRGLFPRPHRRHEPQPDWFRDVEWPQSIRGIVRLVRDQIKTANAQGIDWRAIIDGLRPHTQALWKSLSIEEQRRFMRHLRPFWESHRHRVAPPVLALKDRMAERGQVSIYRAHIVSITEERADCLDVTLYDRSARGERRLRVAFVINCTGPECNYYKLKDPLIVNLLARGLVHPDPLFLGLVTAPNGAVVSYLGQMSNRIYTLGSVQKGMLFETTAVPELRVQAKALAETLVRGTAGMASNQQGQRAAGSEDKIVIVSNRGPNDFVWQDDEWLPRAASGGLMSMIDPLARQPDVTWFCCVSEPPSANEARGALYTTAADQADPEHHIVPVPLPARIYQDY